jgi:probable blue pigment (indigoidine) exporter
MTRTALFVMAASAPANWGSTYLVTTELLPPGYPMTAALLRALPAGLLLLLITRRLPEVSFLPKILVLGVLNFSLFWWLLFVAAYRLPGGLAATIGALQPLVVLILSKPILGHRIRAFAVVAALGGVIGVALLVLSPEARLDVTGVLAAAGGALSMALGVVMTRKWQPQVPALVFTGWQLTAGGLVLLPIALIAEPPLPPLSLPNIAGFTYLGLLGGVISYVFWFRGIATFGPTRMAPLGLLSPVAAVLLGWVVLQEVPDVWQLAGMVLVLASVVLSQRVSGRNQNS